MTEILPKTSSSRARLRVAEEAKDPANVCERMRALYETTIEFAYAHTFALDPTQQRFAYAALDDGG